MGIPPTGGGTSGEGISNNRDRPDQIEHAAFVETQAKVA